MGSREAEAARKKADKDKDFADEVQKRTAVKALRTMPAQKPGKSKQNYSTPPEFIAAVKARFGIKDFYYDLAAEPENTKGLHHYCEEEDTLKQDWTKPEGKQLWLNPEFGNIAPYAMKCASYSTAARAAGRGGRLFFLTPASIGANWFAAHVYRKALVIGLQGRLSFDGIAPYPKDCMLSVFGVPTGFEVWDWRKDAPRSKKGSKT